MKKRLIWIFLIASSLSACGFNYPKDRKGFDRAGVLASPVSYAQVRDAVIGPQCLRCHSQSGPAEGGITLDTHAEVIRVLAKIERSAVTNKTMPPGGGLSEEPLTLLESWIQQGAPENPRPGEVPLPTDRNGRVRSDWATVKERVFERRCNDCHSQPSPEAGLDLTTYTEVAKAMAKIYERAVIRQDMPLEPYPRLTREEKRLLSDWIADGMPQ